MRLDPVELVAPDGTAVAHEGERVDAGGGGGEAKPGTPCARPGEWTFFINGAPGLVKGVLTGRLIAVGGATSNPRPLTGHVTASGPRASQTVQVGPDGNYKLNLPPGTYTLTGTSPLYDGGHGTCRPIETTIAVTAGTTDTADVICSEK